MKMFIEDFTDELNTELDDGIKTGFLNPEYFTLNKFNKNSEVHSRVQAIIAKVCFRLGFYVEIEKSFKYVYKERKCYSSSDISIYEKGKDNKHKLYAFIEYDSTNSADERFWDVTGELGWDTSALRKFKGYYDDSRNKEFPENWIFISTLPDEKIESKNWHNYYSKLKKTDKKFVEILKSPFKYYFGRYKKWTKKVLQELVRKKGIKVNVFLLNLNKNRVTYDKIEI